MKPEYNSKKVLSYTQAIAKMIEFDVPEQDRNINITKNPEELFTLVIGMLGDISETIINSLASGENTEIQENNIRFCASFFDAYKNTKRLNSLDTYTLLIGASAYYLCNLPGSTNVLVSKLSVNDLNLQAAQLDKLLYWLLKNDYSNDLTGIESYYKDLILELSAKFYNYFQTGDKESDIYVICDKLQKKIYSQSTPRELFFCDLIYAICIKKIRNSCWKRLPGFSGLEKEAWNAIISRKTFIKELWPSQLLLGKEHIFEGQSAVIQMPTSAGKTKSTEIIIRSAFLAERTNFAVIVAPFRALCHEIEGDFHKAFFNETNVSIDEINDAFEDSEISLFVESSKKHIIIVTPEKLYYMLCQQQTFAEKVGLIIFDEGHQFDSGERGVTYELLLTELKRFLPSNCQRILISAVIHNAEQISEWLSPSSEVVKSNNALPTERSIGFVEFDHGIGQIHFVNQGNYNEDAYFVPKVIPTIELPKLRKERKRRFFPDIKDTNSIAVSLALKMSTKESVAIFCGSKTSVNAILNLANDYFNRIPSTYEPKGDISEIQKLSYLIAENLGIDNCIYTASEQGIFAHHADIPHGIKMAIEYAMHESLVSFIVCTSTLAQGVNLPIKYLFISSTQQGRDRIKVRDFHNLIGRVGRAGKLTEGCIIFTNPNIYQKIPSLWKNTTQLLNPENSEDCTSSLLSIFEPFYADKVQLPFKTVKSIIDLYYNYNENIDYLAEQINSDYPNFDVSNLKNQISLKFNYIEKIENFLMMLGDNISKPFAIEIAKSTLAYQIANDEQKTEIESLFSLIAEEIEKKVENKDQLPFYAKTLRGLNQTLDLQKKLLEKRESILTASSASDLLDILWDLFIDGNIQNSAFNFYADKTKLKNATIQWLNGASFFELFKTLKDEKINRQSYIKIESCVNIFENGIAYSGSVLINAITEILNSFDAQKYASTINLLKLFQKQLKYGLPTFEAILIYELGFCDRVIAKELSQIVSPAAEKYEMQLNMLSKKDDIVRILQKYPSYYKTVFERLY